MSSFNRIVIASEESGPDAPVQDAAQSSTPAVEAGVPPQNPNAEPSSSLSEAEGNQAESGDRPQWLPEKFKSAEDLAKAYSELEKKLSSPKAEAQKEAPKPEATEGEEGKSPELDEPVKEDEAPKADSSKVDLTPFHNEWADKGELSEDSFTKLESMGFPKELVQQYITGFQATQAQEAQTIYAETGGQEGYKAMTEWAAQTMSPQEIAAYDGLVTGGDINAAKIAAKGLYAQYVAANGQPPKLLSGTPSRRDANSPFRSSAEVVAAMSDPRYKSDAAFRRDVEERLAKSDVF
jgi:hypothetical protein